MTECNIRGYKTCLKNGLRKPSNWGVMIATFFIWVLVDLTYAANQNFDMVVTVQTYVMLTSLMSVVVGILSNQVKGQNLVITGAVGIVISLLTIVTMKVFLTIVAGYLFLYVSIFLFLLQIKYFLCFACHAKKKLERGKHVND